MKSKLYIPKKLKVGFQKRDDCYLKTLAYVIYWDDKGVLRKEKSWEGWRDKKIDPIEVENKPCGNFTLNKDVHRDGGDFGVGRNHIRVYDDRGIEFEITPENLVFILMHTNCVKRSLEGEFVYSYFGQDLVLLPTNCQDYKASAEFTKLQGEKVGAKNFTPGHWYLTKDQKELMYLGRYDWYEWKAEKVGEKPRGYLYRGKTTEDINHYFRRCKKRHIFISKDKKVEPHSDGGKISRQLTDSVDDDYVGNLELFLGSFNSGAVENIELEEFEPNILDRAIEFSEIAYHTGSHDYRDYNKCHNFSDYNFFSAEKSGDTYNIYRYSLILDVLFRGDGYYEDGTRNYKISTETKIGEALYKKSLVDSLYLKDGVLASNKYRYLRYSDGVISSGLGGLEIRREVGGEEKLNLIPLSELKGKKLLRMKVNLSNGRSFSV
jgi:hypothetical protein